MDKKIAGLIGAVSTLASVAGSQAVVAAPARDVLQAASYDDLLQPIPNAVAQLKASDAVLSEQGAVDDGAKIEMAQYYYHHHHHHHRFFRPFYRHHHHHHRYYRQYHHHHHHNNYYRY